MHRLTRPTIIILAFVFVLILIGCSVENIKEPETGSIRFALSNEVKSRGFVPTIPMKIDHYSIAGQGPNTEDVFNYVDLDDDYVIISNLNPGEWNIVVTGYNSENIAIGEGGDSVMVIAGITKSKSILVEEIEGEGSFNLALSLPESEEGGDEVEITTVDLTFIQVDKTPITYSSLPLTNDSLTVEELPSGYYTVIISLADKDDEEVWANAYSLRIVQDQTTVGTITLTNEELARWGGLNLTIVDGMPVTFSVSLSANKAVAHQGQAVTFSATPSLSGDNYTYWWFVDGKKLEGENSASLTLREEFSLGLNNVSVVAIRGGVMASARVQIYIEEAREEIDPYFVVKLLNHETKELVYEFDLEYSLWFRYYNTGYISEPLHAKKEDKENQGDGVGFYLGGTNRIIGEEESFTSPHDNSVMVLPDNLTLVGIIISGFNGVGDYDCDRVEIELEGGETKNYIPGYIAIETNQVNLETEEQLYAVFDSGSDFDSGNIKIASFGEIGELVKGEFKIEKMTLIYNTHTNQIGGDIYYDMIGEFKVPRGEDLEEGFFW